MVTAVTSSRGRARGRCCFGAVRTAGPGRFGHRRQSADASPRYIPSVLTTSLTGDTPLARAGGLVAGGSYDVALAHARRRPGKRSRKTFRPVAAACGHWPDAACFVWRSASWKSSRCWKTAPTSKTCVSSCIWIAAIRFCWKAFRRIGERGCCRSIKTKPSARPPRATTPKRSRPPAARWPCAGRRRPSGTPRNGNWPVGNAAAAMADFQNAIDLSPRSGKPLVARAQAYERLGCLDDALRDAESRIGT